MPRIGATISGLEQLFLSQLARFDSAVLDSAVRLTTGKQFTGPSENPSAFIEIGQFERRLSVVQDTRRNVEAGASVGAQSQLVIDEIRTQLETIRDALELDVDGSLTFDERTTQQAAIDSAVESINELAKTEINGKRYLDGSVNYRFSGKDSSEISGIEVYSLRETQFSGTVTSAATQAKVTYTGAAAAITADATFTLTGKRGSSAVSVSSGQTLASAADRINQVSHETGLLAVAAGDDLILTSVDYGDSATIDVDVSSGSFITAGTTQGADAVVTVNGKSLGGAAVDGNRVRYASNGTHVAFDFQPGFTGAFSTVTVLDDDVSQFQLAPDLQQVTQFGLPGVSAALLGGLSGRLSDLASGGSLSGLAGNTSQAIRVLDEALSGLTRTEGTVDAFADVTVQSSASLLDGLAGELEETVNDLSSVNEERESLLLTKNQSLGSNTISAMSILQQQQASVLALVRLVAGV